ELAHPQVAAQAQQVVQVVGDLCHRPQRRLDLAERIDVDQLAQFLLPEKLLQQIAIEGQRLCAALRRRGVVLVHVGRDVVEQERRGERRGARALHLDEIDLTRAQSVQELLQCRKVEDVLQA